MRLFLQAAVLYVGLNAVRCALFVLGVRGFRLGGCMYPTQPVPWSTARAMTGTVPPDAGESK